MTETTNLKLPLVQPAQAQKHVTVNEALVRIDGLAQLVLESLGVTDPPVAAPDGLAWAVPAGAVNAWGGQDGRIALSENGGWVFIDPRAGWRAFVTDAAVQVLFNGTDWVPGGVSLSPAGAGMRFGVAEIDHEVLAGATSTTAPVIPAQSVVFGVTGRVIAALTGTVTDFELGVAGSSNRYGSGYGVGEGAWLRGLTGTPITYYADTELVLTANGGSFAGGTVRLSVHFAALELPGA